MKTVKITPEVGAVLARSTVENNIVRLPEGQLDRPLYTAVDKVLKALGGKWHTGKRGHVFEAGIGDDLAEALAAGHVVDLKKTHEQFFTPADLAERMAEMLDLAPGMKILEPSAGDGALLRAVLDATGSGAFVYAYEIDDQLRTKLLGDLFRCFGAGGLGVDFMQASVEPVFDRVIMNPPFSGNQDIRHVLRAWSMLKPGGRLVAIMSEHPFFGNDRESNDFRGWLKQIPGAYADRLPEGTFKAAGTMVQTRLVYAEKPL